MDENTISDNGGRRKLLSKPLLRIADKTGRINLGRKFAGQQLLIMVAESRLPMDEVFWGKFPDLIEQSDGTFIRQPIFDKIEKALGEADKIESIIEVFAEAVYKDSFLFDPRKSEKDLAAWKDVPDEEKKVYKENAKIIIKKIGL